MTALRRFLALAAFSVATVALLSWRLAPPTIYAAPTIAISSVGERNGERVLWVRRFDVLKVAPCDAGGDNGIFQVRYVRPRPFGWGWERSARTVNLYRLDGTAVRGTNRAGADVGHRVIVPNGRWAAFPEALDRFTHYTIEVPCQLPNGRWIDARWGPARIGSR